MSYILHIENTEYFISSLGGIESLVSDPQDYFLGLDSIFLFSI
jgi:hypothetical protein